MKVQRVALALHSVLLVLASIKPTQIITQSPQILAFDPVMMLATSARSLPQKPQGISSGSFKGAGEGTSEVNSGDSGRSSPVVIGK
jgi:hypothetical protein